MAEATWTKTSPNRWEDGEGYAITAVAGRRGAQFLVIRPDGRSYPDAERSLTAAQNEVAADKAVRAGQL